MWQSAPMLSWTYRLLTNLGAPLIGLYLLKRRWEGREDAQRFRERKGFASLPRHAGRLIWCHAASVGEVASLMTLIDKLRDTYPATQILVTTGTVTSAKLLEGRLPPKVFHQYMPVDRAPYVARFLNHWQPDLALWIESELWPNMLSELRTHSVAAVLLNGRMSEKSFRNWYRFKGWTRTLLSTFTMCLTQTEDEKGRFIALGAKNVRSFGNLKYAAKPLPYNEGDLNLLKDSLTGRICWVMSSTHRGEEAIALAAHKKLQTKWPNLLTIIVPRHARRGDEVTEIILASALSFARRSLGQAITRETEIYLADTMGELGLFYRLCPIACIGGSFSATGGHNPIEAAQLNCAVIFGPAMYNFSQISREFVHQKAAIQLQNENELAFTLDHLLSNMNERANYAQAARVLADQKRHVLDEILEALEPWLSANHRKAA